MSPAGFLFLLLLTGGNTFSTEQPELRDDQPKSSHSFGEMPGGNISSSALPQLHDDLQNLNNSSEKMPDEKNCSYEGFLNFLNLNKNKNLYSMFRPVRHHRTKTEVHLDMVIYAILDVREKDQIFVPYVWIYMSWVNEHVKWNPEQFCGIKYVEVPTELFWKPDIMIEEMIEKDKAPPVPYLTLNYDGETELRNDQVLISTCRMHVYKFPFDTQTCKLSFKSIIHADTELSVMFNHGSAITEWVNVTQYEWLFLYISAHTSTVRYFGYNQSVVVYTMKMKRRSALYVVNFILPVLFFLCLDLASFLISHGSGEKLSFKVTVLLAVTVLQLILNEILPATSNKIPIIAIYCIGIFVLMLLSLLETVLMMYLMAKDQHLSEDGGDKANSHNCFADMKKCTRCAFGLDVSADETPSKMLSVAKEGGSSQSVEASHTLEKVSEETKEIQRRLTLISSSSSSSSSRNEEEKPGYWTRLAKRLNRVFVISYVTVISVFLIFIYKEWHTED